MDRTWALNSVSTPPTLPASLEIGYPTDSGSVGTTPGAWWYYMVTEEIRNAILAAGITPAAGSVTQLSSAIVAIAQSAVGVANRLPVRVIDTVGVTYSGVQTVDGVTLVNGDRVLRNVGNSVGNGVWVVNTSGTWTRPPDYNTGNQILEGAMYEVSEGTANSVTVWALKAVTGENVIVGTTASQFINVTSTLTASINSLNNVVNTNATNAANTYAPLLNPVFGGQIVAPQGTYTAPGITFAGDPGNDTGFYHPADGIIGVTNNGLSTATFTQAGITTPYLMTAQALLATGTLPSNGQFVSVAGSGSTWYSTFTRNDGANFYFLQSPVQNTAAAAATAGWNSFKPFYWNLTNGNVTIDGTGKGTAFGGPISSNQIIINTNGSSQSLFITDTGGSGANILLSGNGSTTPNKTIRAANGVLQTVNSAYTAILTTLTDTGDYWALGGLSCNGGITSGANIVGPGSGFTLGNTTGLNNGGAIQVYDSSHGNGGLSFMYNGSWVAAANSSGFTAASLLQAPTITASNGSSSLGQFNAVGGTGSSWYNAMFYNGGGNAYLLSSNQQASQSAANTSTWNSLRPFSWNLSTGAVTIDGTGAGTSFGGQVTSSGHAINTSGSTQSLIITDTGGNGANIRLNGNGGTTPNKTLRSVNGQFQIANSAFNNTILTLDDAGNLWTAATIVSAGSINSSANFIGPGAGFNIGNTTGLNSGGDIQVFDSSHGNGGVIVLNNGNFAMGVNGSGLSVAATVSANAVSSTTTVSGANINGGTAVSAPTINATTVLNTPTVNSTSSVNSPVINASSSMTTPAITVNGTASMQSVSASVSVTMPTRSAGDNSSNGASTAFVATALANYFPSGTRMPFAQATAPTGWVQDTSDATNNRMMVVVNNNTGNSVAGTNSPIINNVVPSHTHGFTTGYESNSHSHSVNDPGHNHSISDPGHVHSTIVSGHTHGVSDPGHAHNIHVNSRVGSAASVSDSGGTSTYPTGAYTDPANTGISLQSAADTVTINSSATGISNNASGTSISLNNENASHNHSGTTDAGSSQTSWTPRYLTFIICVKS